MSAGNTSKMFLHKRFEYTTSGAPTQDSTARRTAAQMNYVVPQGYKPFGLLGFSSGANAISVISISLEPTTDGYVMCLRPVGSTSSGAVTCYVDVLFIKESCIHEIT